GGLSSLLIISPTGEWACGGRSAHHQWNEAASIVIFECNAIKWHQAGRDDIAGAMKRSAHLAYQSMQRWQRPSGEMWIVKNRAEPHYNATGLQRVHKRGVPLSPLSDSAANSDFGPFDYHERQLIAPGIQWENPAAAIQPTTEPALPTWLSLANFINGVAPEFEK